MTHASITAAPLSITFAPSGNGGWNCQPVSTVNPRTGGLDDDGRLVQKILIVVREPQQGRAVRER